MAILKRLLHKSSTGSGATGEDSWSLVFDTDTKRLYVEHEWNDGAAPGESERRLNEMDVAEYLTQGGQTAGHRELWRLLRGIFDERKETPEV